MAQISKGILGGVTGKVGTVVGANWRGIEYIRSMPAKRRFANTQKQQTQQLKFALVKAFLQSMTDVLELGYKNQAFRMTPLNSALSYHLKNAVTGEYPDEVTIVYPQAQISRGNLPNATSPAAAAGAAGTVSFNWTDNTGLGKAKAGDKAILVAYCASLGHAEYLINPPRSAGSASLAVPAFSGKAVHTWISFVTADEKDIATSVFTGEVNVA